MATELEYNGLKIRGGKIFLVFTLLSALGGASWTGFTFYSDYLSMKEKILLYTEPDLSSYDEQIAVLKSEVSMILDEVTLLNSVIVDQKNTIRDDIKTMKSDIRLQDRIIKDVETMVKNMDRQLHEDLKLLEEELDANIKKALSNPLAGVK